MVTRWLVAVAAVLFSLTAQAQVRKCQNAEGKVVYSDQACPAGMTSSAVNTRPNTMSNSEERAMMGRESDQPQYLQTQGGGGSAAINQYECERARRNFETSSSSVTSKRQNNEAARAEMNQKCFGTAEAGKIERARAGAPRITVVNPSAHSTRTDQFGNTYTGPAGGILHRQDGRACQDLGATIQCN
jgi:Domain of unknown function (DUF4124)